MERKERSTRTESGFIYETVNQQIINQLEKGNIPWKMPWKKEFPTNLVSKKEYEGFNWWLLQIQQEERGYESNVWATFKQISEANGRVKKGEKSTPIIFWKMLERLRPTLKDKEGNPKIETIPLLRYYNVFNLDQTEGVKRNAQERVIFENTNANQIIENYKKQIDVKYGGNRAYYSPREDYIQIPHRSKFISDDEFYSTAFHEMTHSTGHAKRLNRFGENYAIHSSKEAYSKEELVAEMGSAYLCAKTGILPSVIENSGAYIASWLKALQNDRTLLVSAGGRAQKAVNFILS